MLRTPRLGLVERTAAEVIRNHNINSLPVCPFSIAEQNDIIVEGKSAGHAGCSGMLLRSGDNFGILYSTDIKNTGFQRFSVAHELGHYFLPDHPESVIKNGMHVSKAGFGSADPYEREADFFAAALLMPKTLFRTALGRAADGLEGVIQLADECATSLTATAINCAKITDEPVAVVLSANGLTLCCFQSETMKRARVGWINKGEPVPPSSLTSALLQGSSGARVDPSYGETDLQDWFGTDRPVPAREEVIRLHRQGDFLTLLLANDLRIDEEDGDEEDDDEESLVEQWTPRFRR